MKKGYWKCYEVDDCMTICARSAKEAYEFALTMVDKEDLYPYPDKVNTKEQYMSYTIEDIPVKKYRTKATESWEGEPAVTIFLKRAVRYYVKKHKPKEPFIICTSF